MKVISSNLNDEQALQAYREETDVEVADQLLVDLFKRVEELIKRIVRAKYAVRPIPGTLLEDVAQDISLVVFARLKGLKDTPQTTRIMNFKGYISTITYNEWERLVRKQPALLAFRIDPYHEALDRTLVDAAPQPDDVAVRRKQLQQVWPEICALPRDQATAFLLYMRDNEGVELLSLFVETGLCDIPELAELIGMSPTKLDEIWPDLPLNAARIGALMGRSEQAIYGLIKAAVNRLRRRKKTLGAWSIFGKK